MGVVLIHANRQADMTKILGAFRKHATALKNGKDNINSSLVKATTNSTVSQIKCHHFATELYYYFVVKEQNNTNCNMLALFTVRLSAAGSQNSHHTSLSPYGVTTGGRRYSNLLLVGVHAF